MSPEWKPYKGNEFAEGDVADLWVVRHPNWSARVCNAQWMEAPNGYQGFHDENLDPVEYAGSRITHWMQVEGPK
jgi:hypothetical protein